MGSLASDEILVKFNARSFARHYWHRTQDGKLLCSGISFAGRDGLEEKAFGALTDQELHKLCRLCLGASRYRARTERKKAIVEGRACYPDRPLCPACNAEIAPAEGHGERLKWWNEGRCWKCFGCGRRFDDDMKRL
jgi:hypothetical protein